MTSTRIKVYGRKRARQSSSSGSSAEHPEDKSSSTPPPEATITLDDMARKMRRRAARVRRSSSNSKKKSGPPSKEFEPPRSKRPKLARTDSMQVDNFTPKATALSSVSPSERNILAGLSSGAPRRQIQTPATSSMFAKENRDEDGRVLSRGAQASDAMLTPVAASSSRPGAASASRPGPSSARLASPLRLSTSGDPFVRRRQHTVPSRHSYAPGKATRGRSRRSDAMPSFSSARRRTSVQVQKTRLSNSWLLSPPHIEPQSLLHSLPEHPDPSSDNLIRFPLSRPIAFSTPTRARQFKRRAPENGSDDLMQVDEPPAFLAPSSQVPVQAVPSSRQTHASATTFDFSAPVSAIGSAVPSVRAPTSPLRYATPDPVAADPAPDNEEERHPEPSPASSGGDELRDMFNVLGLDEDERWTRMTSEGDFSLDLFKPPSPGALERTVMRTRRGARSVRFAPPTIKMRTLSSPLRSSTSGSEDELLLKAGDEWADPESDL